MHISLAYRRSFLNALRAGAKTRGAVSAVFALCFLLSAPALLAVSGPLGVNGAWDWVNLTNGLAGWNPILNAPPVPVDVNGWPASDFNFDLDLRKNMPYDGPDALGIDEDFAGAYTVSFTGQATISGGQVGDGAAAIQVLLKFYNPLNNQTTAEVVIEPGDNLLELTFTNTKRLRTDQTGTGITNLVILRPGYPLGTKQVFTDGTLKAYASEPFSAIRFSAPDAMTSYQTYCTATTLCVTHWANRVLPTQALQTGTGLAQNNAPTSQSYGTAWEYMIELANATNKDMWINVPVSADDDYVTQLASLILNGDTVNGVTYPGLKSNLHVYVEYSNEVWNFGFHEYTWAAITGQAEGLTVDQFYVSQSIHIAKLFHAVFGDTGNPNPRVRPVIDYQVRQQFTIFNDLNWWEQTNNDLVKNYVYAVGDAPYISPSDTSTVDASFISLRSGRYPYSSDSGRRDTIAWRAVASYFGLHQVGYESGPEDFADANMGYVTRDPRISAAITHYFNDNWFAAGGELVNYFSMQSFVNQFCCYGLVEDYDHTDTPEMNGVSLLASAPPATLTAGNVLPWTVGQQVSIDPSQHIPTAFGVDAVPGAGINMNLGQTFAYLLRSTTSGQYAITFYGQASSSAAQIAVYVDDQNLGTVQLPVTTGETEGFSPPVNVTLTPGFHTLFVVNSGGVNFFNAGTGAIDVSLTSGTGTAVVPSAPMNVAVVNGDGAATLTWASATEAAAYNVERSSASGGPYTQIAQVPGGAFANAYTDSTVTDGSYYYYVITAVDSVGASAFSPETQAFPAPAAIPATPTNVQISFGGGDSTPFYSAIAILSWSPVPNASGYNVYRGSTLLTTVAPQVGTQYTDLGISDGATYTYTVTAVNSAGASAKSSPVTASPVETVFQPPTNLTVQNRGGYSFISWTPDPLTVPEYETAFNVKRSLRPGGPYTTVVSTNTFNTYDFSAIPGIPYYYEVTATNGIGESAPSNSATGFALLPGFLGYGAGSSDTPIYP